MLDVPNDFGKIGFSGTLRPSQVAAVSVIKPQLELNEKKLHIVAPPGSGKTVLGLYVWSDLVRLPTLVLSPNSAIQAQWAARTSLFDLDGKEEQISTDGKKPGLLTSLTYQSITMPRKGGEDLDASAIELWVQTLIQSEEADTPESAMLWLSDLKTNNPDYYSSRLSVYRKKVRDEYAKHGNALWTLHESSRETLLHLKEKGIGLIILDECHHLLHHWGRVLVELREFFDDPIVLGLTATPPDFSTIDEESAERYQTFFGEIDYEVPVPALVRDSNLAPYQDLCYFVRPATHEIEYISKVDEEFDQIMHSVEQASTYEGATPRLQDWIFNELDKRIIPGGKSVTWTKYNTRNETFCHAARVYLHNSGINLPPGVPSLHETQLEMSRIAYLRPVLDRYVRHGLRRSKSKEDHTKGQEVTNRLRMLGIQITETGVRPCASPVGRIMAYASSKIDALSDIIATEMQSLGPDIRAVIITDFEKTSATTLVEGVMDEEAGGAIAAFRAMVRCDSGDILDPVLMTGSTVLVDDDLAERFLQEARLWLQNRNLEVELNDEVKDGYHVISGKGKHWIPRYYSMMITEFFQQGITKCLIGTRGLLGEGWDASKINVLVDLTTVTTSMSINQLRGRSIRLDKDWPGKVANNWDIVCLAEEFTNGFKDYARFEKKHKQLYGVCDDGAIEKGVGHVHAAFTEAEPEGISEGMALFNDEMLKRSRNRPLARQLWGIGQPFSALPKEAVETKCSAGFGGGFGFKRNETSEWSDESIVQAIAYTISNSLIHTGHISQTCRASGGNRGGGWLRMHLENSTEEESKIFTKALEEVLGPLDKPRYVISRYSRFMTDTWLTKLLPEVLAKYLRPVESRLVMHHSVPKILAGKKEDADVFLRYWQEFVSPAELFYAHSNDGKQRLEAIRQQNLVPKNSIHRKQIFL
ncbi:MAG: DEAD/DEAH box helicase family protein [Candidatus Poseidoniaceae archaeon]